MESGSSLTYLLSLLKGMDPQTEELLITVKIRNVFQLAELGLSLEVARNLHNGALEYVNRSQYGLDLMI